LNWLTPTVLTANGSYSLNAASGSNQIFRINTPVANEYFLLENRQKTGLDVSLKGSGLAIFHVNTNSGGNWDENLKLVDLEEADARNDLDNQYNRGDAGDLFPGSTNKTTFNNESNPNSRTYTGANTNISISNIAIDGTGKASFSLSVLSATVPVVNSFTPTSGPAGAGVAITGTNFISGSTIVRFNGITASQVYVASSTLMYVTVPTGATTGKIEVITNGVNKFSTNNFTVAAISSSWSSRTGLKTSRAQHGAVAVNGKIYVFGGYNSTGILSSLEIYDPNTNTWSTGANMPSGRRGMFFTLGSNGLIYAIGGRSASNTSTSSTYSYNPATNTWATLASVPIAVWEGAAAATSNGKIYLFGGDMSTSTSGSNITYIYNIATNSWSTGASMPTAVKQHSAITGKDGKIYVIGGRSTSGSAPTGKVQIYNPGTNTWTTGASMPIAIVKFGAVLAENGKIYIVGGKAQYNNNAGPFFHTVEVYTPSTNSWATGPVIPVQNCELEAVNNNGNLYAIGGTNGTYRNYCFRLIMAPTAPSGLTAATYSSQINLKWKDNALNESNYVIERAMASAGPFTVIATLGSNATTYTNTGLVAGQTYFYRVKATNSAGSSAYSNTASTTIYSTNSSPAPVAQQSRINSLLVRPNPAVSSTQLSFSVDEDQQVQLDIFNMEGKLVSQVYKGAVTAGQTYQFEWNSSFFASGIYISRLTTRKGIFTERIVVISSGR
jgi:N-acetylneuraminic acid mutarotase